MSLLSRLVEGRSVENPLRPLTDKSLISLLGGPMTTSSISVSEESAIGKFIAIYRAVALVSGAIASLELRAFREGPARQPFTSALIANPHPDMTRMEFWETVLAHQLLWGNAYAAKIRDGSDQVTELWPYPPHRFTVSRIQPTRANPWGKELELRHDSGKVETLTPRDVLHIPGPGYNGLTGLSPIGVARQAVGMGLAAEEYGARLFGSGMLAGGVLQTDQKLDQPTADALKQRLMEKLAGLGKAHEIAVLDAGAKFVQLTIPPEDAQFIECVVPETQLTMADGTLRRADEIRVGDSVLGWDHTTDRLLPSAVAAVGDNGIHPLVRITTDRGRSLTTTENHPYLASPRQRCEKCGRRHQAAEGWPQSWVRADALQVGDYVRVGMDAAVDGPMDRQTGWMLGALIGDGQLRSSGTGFSGIDEGVLGQMSASAEAIGASMHQSGATANHYFRGNGYGTKNRMRAFLAEHGIADKHSHTKTVPETVMAGGREASIGFLSGLLDTDGTVAHLTTAQPHVRWDSVSYDLMRGSQHLLASLGVQSALSVKRTTYKGAPWVGYQLQVSGRAPVALVAGILEPAHAEKRDRLAAWAAQMPAARQHPDFFLLDRIRTVERLPTGETITIEVEGTHSHVTNGLITHNSRKFQVREIARLYGIPPYLLGDVETSSSWGTGIEQQSIGFVVYTLRPWLSRAEQRFSRECLPDGIRAEFNTDGLLRGDAQARANAAKTWLGFGVKKRNEVRVEEGLPPDDAADNFMTPLNYELSDDEQAVGELPDNVIALKAARAVAAQQGVEPVFEAGEIRCAKCDKLLAELAAAPYRLTCPRCKAVAEAL